MNLSPHVLSVTKERLERLKRMLTAYRVNDYIPKQKDLLSLESANRFSEKWCATFNNLWCTFVLHMKYIFWGVPQ